MTLHRSKAADAASCPIRDVLDGFGDRWSLLVLMTLEAQGTLRFTALKASIEDVSQRMLAQTLRRLEQTGMVLRTAYPTIPPRVDYALTPLGQSFMQPLHGLLNWAVAHHDEVRAARTAFIPPPVAKAR